MSRLGKQPVAIPEKTEVSVADNVVTVKGPNGTLTRAFTDDVTVTVDNGEVTVAPTRETIHARALWGTYSAHINNMVKGVNDGFEKKLQVEGVGYRAELKGNTLVLSVGFSHQVEHEVPEGVTVKVEKNEITITGADKEVVGQFAAVVRATKKPEPYKGKGIRYVGEYVIRKQGKKAV